jgi:purine-cytosine permease-like protein
MIGAILLIVIVQGVVAALGAGAIKIMKWISSLLLLLAGGVETYHVLTQWNLSRILAYRHSAMIFTAPHMLDISFINIWTWLQVGDFARFSKSRRGAFLGSWLGLWTGQAWFVLVGAVGVIGLGLATGHLSPEDGDPSRLMSRLGLSSIALAVIFLSCVSVSASNLYGAGMALLSLFDRKKGGKIHPGAALATASLIQVMTAFIPLLFSSFISYFTDFLTLIGGVFIPLWSLVLADYVLVRKGRLDTRGLFAVSPASPYWARNGFNPAGFLALLSGIVFYYGFPHLVPRVTNSVGVSIPTILSTIAVYRLLSWLFQKKNWLPELTMRGTGQPE